MAQNDTTRNNPGNFANDRQRAAEAGRKGGEHSHGGQQQHGSGQDDRQQGDTSRNRQDHMNDRNRSGQH